MSTLANKCTDRVVGAILASWRYDISGISPEMRRDYENHFAECARCRARQKFHRSLDVTLAVLTSTAALFFLFALAVFEHIKPLEHVAFKVLGLDIFDMYIQVAEQLAASLRRHGTATGNLHLRHVDVPAEEMMFFGGLFCAYLVFRASYYQAFEGSQKMNTGWARPTPRC